MKQRKPKQKSIWKLYFRGFKLAYSTDPKFFWSEVFNAAGGAVRPFFNSVMAALVIDGVMAGKPAETLLLYAAVTVTVNLLVNVVIQYTAGKRYIRKSMWQKFLSMFFNSYSEKMDYAYLESTKIKELKNRIDRYTYEWNGIGIIIMSHVHSVTRMVSGILMSASLLVSMCAAQPAGETVGLFHFVNSGAAYPLFASVLLVNALVTFRLSYRRQSLSNEVDAYISKNVKCYYGAASFLLANDRAADTKIYGLDRAVLAESESWFHKQHTHLRAYFRSLSANDALGTVQATVTLLLIYMFVSLKALSGAFGIGSVVLYVAAFTQFTDAVTYIGDVLGNIRGSRRSLEDQFAYIDLENKMYQGTLTVEKRRDRDYEVEFKHVSFKYPGSETYALHDVSLRFKIGEKLAVVGRNGSGKTTFIKLMCRLYDPTEGEILLNGINIQKYDYKEYMSIFSVVFQDFRLFAYPLGENVAVGKTYDAERVKECLIQAGMGERLQSLPKGLETCLYKSFDPEGVEISGGEAQKIALARALYKNAPFIILDEPTAALDPIAEAEVYAKFNEIVGDKTAIYISHRLSSCRFCDTIAVFDKGAVVQVGSHENLVADEKGKYYELWHAQAQYYVK